MREEIYQKFHPIGKTNLKQYIKKLNIANRSYDFKKRAEMLRRWAIVMNCKWFQCENLRREVLKYMENNQTKLPTPLNIKDFASATAVNRNNILDKEKLLAEVDKVSQSTPERFARDIGEMKDNELLLLCFPFISGYFGFRTEVVKTEYNKLLEVLKINGDYAFERARTKLQDKIEFSYFIRFSHPSYSEALPFLLLDDGMPTEINTKFFSRVLINLSDNEGARDVAYFVVENFDKLPGNVRNELLIKLAYIHPAFYTPSISGNVIMAVTNNFDKLPENVRNELLIKLADDEYNAIHVAFALTNKRLRNKLPENFRNELLIKLAGNKDTAYVISTIPKNFDKQPEKIQKLFKLAYKKDAAILDPYH